MDVVVARGPGNTSQAVDKDYVKSSVTSFEDSRDDSSQSIYKITLAPSTLVLRVGQNNERIVSNETSIGCYRLLHTAEREIVRT